MESRSIPREADVAPATSDPTTGSLAGWTPANPAPLGLAAFATTTFVLSVINANLVGSAATPAVFGLTLAFGGLGQLIAGIWEFRTGNTFGAVAFCSYAGFWISFYILAHSSLSGVPKAEVPAAVGLFLWAWTIFTAIMLIAALRTTGVLVLVFILLTLTFLFLAIGNSGASSGTIHLGGYLGIITAAVAWYAAAAGVINATWGRDLLPTFPLTA